ncbi:MAG: hypothetical protein QME57_00845 [Patescibacteria group bacterium]|nr:hypothetical protein [Patescibacteria group bacterium]
MVEIIPKPGVKVPYWQNILFYFSLGLFLMVVLSYFILNIYLNRAETTLKKLEEALAKEKTAEEIALGKEIFGYQKKIENFSKLINRHLFGSKFFEFIEKNTHPQIWFSNLDLNPAKGEANLAGEAENFIVLYQQLQIFRTNPSVKNLDLGKIVIGKEGKINFDLNLGLDPSLFKFK